MRKQLYTLDRYRKVGFGVACVVLAIVAFYILLPFWQALAWGISLAILVHPIFTRLSRKLHRNVAAAITTVLTMLFIVGPIMAIGFALIGETNHLIGELKANATVAGGEFSFTAIVQNANAQIAPLAKDYLGIQNFDLKETIVKVLNPDSIAGSAPQLAKTVVHILLTFVFALLLLFFLLKDGPKMREPSLDLIPLERHKAEQLLDSIYDTVHATFIGVVLISLINGIAIGFTFALLGLPAALLFGIVTALLSFIPIAGAPLVYIPTAAILAYSGQWGEAAVVIAVGSLFVSLTIDKIYRSVLIGSKINLHPMAVFFSLLGGIFTLGPVGMIVGPVVLIVLIAALDVFREIAHPDDTALAAKEEITTPLPRGVANQ